LIVHVTDAPAARPPGAHVYRCRWYRSQIGYVQSAHARVGDFRAAALVADREAAELLADVFVTRDACG
jgi:hypothetical protein